MTATKPIVVHLPLDMRRELRRLGIEVERSMSELLKEALRNHLASRPQPELRARGGDDKAFTVRLPPRLHAKLTKRAYTEARSMREIMAEATAALLAAQPRRRST